jgi:hypothetical protein
MGVTLVGTKLPVGIGGSKVAASLEVIIRRIKQSADLLVTPRLDRWLLDHPEGIVIKSTADKTLLARLVGDSSNAQRTARFGASNRGTCLRQQVFRFLGMPGLISGDSALQNLFNDGTWRHIRHQMMGMMGGWFTDVEVKAELPQYNLGTSLDGENSSEGWGFELKGTSNFGRIVEYDIPHGHLLQMHTAMLARGHERMVYLAEDKRSQAWKEIIINRDERLIREVKDELNRATDAIEDQRLPEVLNSCKIKKGDEYQGCPFRRFCPSQKSWPKDGAWSKGVQAGGRK